jgi:hypothetical protein
MSWLTNITVFLQTPVHLQELVLDHFAVDRIDRAERLVHQQHGGSAASARATPTRCCWPPDSSFG